MQCGEKPEKTPGKSPRHFLILDIFKMSKNVQETKLFPKNAGKSKWLHYGKGFGKTEKTPYHNFFAENFRLFFLWQV